jgi:hypothetical protein
LPPRRERQARNTSSTVAQSSSVIRVSMVGLHKPTRQEAEIRSAGNQRDRLLASIRPHGLGKLDLAVPLEVLAGYFETVGLVILSINRQHAVAWVEPEPATRDPFDRMLLAQCKVEGLRLVTLDRALAEHPLTWRA